MTTDQTVLFALLGAVFALLIWGRWRYDLVAFVALLVAVIVGVVPAEEVFSGFGHPATVIIALVLVIGRGLSNSGVVELIGDRVAGAARTLSGHIGLMSGVAAALSAVMNNVAALALFIPVELQASAKARRSPALTLMPLSFATILGGLVTLIGTPPNIIVASYRGEALGEPFAMFDFAPVGLACAVLGVAFVALVGWRLIPTRAAAAPEPFEVEGYVAELSVPGGKLVGQRVGELDGLAEEHDVRFLGLVRDGARLAGAARRVEIRAGDVLIVEGGPEAIEKLAGAVKLDYVATDRMREHLAGEDLELMEVVVPQGAAVVGREPRSLRGLARLGVHLLGLSRQGRPFRERVRQVEIRAGDVLLLLGRGEALVEASRGLGCLPLAGRGLQVLQRRKAGVGVLAFAVAIALATLGVVPLPVALAGVATLYVLTGIVPLRELYESIEWPAIVLIGSMIPIGEALEAVGGTGLIGGALVRLTEGFPAVVALALLMAITMTLSDVMNNTATAVIAAPIAVDIAGRLGVSPDPFLMAVAVAASCAFLTPIGHQNNTLILGPGGYRFGDYWRMGLPLELLVLAVGVSAIPLVWPL